VVSPAKTKSMKENRTAKNEARTRDDNKTLTGIGQTHDTVLGNVLMRERQKKHRDRDKQRIRKDHGAPRETNKRQTWPSDPCFGSRPKISWRS
jgi:hypothetical protein